VCRRTGFTNLRDEALIRLYCNTGARLSEIGNLRVEDIDRGLRLAVAGATRRPEHYWTSTSTSRALSNSHAGLQASWLPTGAQYHPTTVPTASVWYDHGPPLSPGSAL